MSNPDVPFHLHPNQWLKIGNMRAVSLRADHFA